MPDPKTALIAVDWGTSSFRAYRLNKAGSILDRVTSDAGILSVSDGQFEDALVKGIAPWIEGNGVPTPVLMSGMIGSRQGWIEADYITPPASLSEMANSLTKVPGGLPAGTYIVPGLSIKDATLPDVMRGEETQIFGALHQNDLDRGTFVMPGTHSKWVQVEGSAITSFMSLMTGEVFAALSGHTILSAFMTAQTDLDEDSFRRGLDAGHASGTPGALLNRIFGARTLPLFDRIEPHGVADYLSGLLIGAEFAEAGDRFDRSVRIIGAAELARRYSIAALHLGMSAEQIDPDCTASGLFAIARQANLLN